MVLQREDPVILVLEKCASNSRLCSVVIWSGHLESEKQQEIRGFATAPAVTSDRGFASGQLMYMSITVRYYRNPDELDRGPTRQMCAWQNFLMVGRRFWAGISHFASLSKLDNAYMCVPTRDCSFPPKITRISRMKTTCVTDKRLEVGQTLRQRLVTN